MKNLVIYHNADFDGKLSRDISAHFLNTNRVAQDVVVYGWDYGQDVPRVDFAEFEKIYLLDVSIPDILNNESLHEKLVWIDHHKSAIERWPSPRRFDSYTIDGVAACRLCWQWFSMPRERALADAFEASRVLPKLQEYRQRQVKEPMLVTLAGEYDVWDLHDDRAMTLQYSLRCIDPASYDVLIRSQFAFGTGSEELRRIADNQLDIWIANGAYARAYDELQNAEFVTAFASTVEWRGLKFLVCNLGKRGNSQIFKAALTKEHDACFGWRYNGKTGMVDVSLYGVPGKDIDLSKIAVEMGGGGHKAACGFRVSLGWMEAMFHPHAP